MDVPAFTFAQILYIKEIQQQLDGRLYDTSVRVFGRLLSFDPSSNVAIIEEDKCQLHIHTELLQQFPYRIGSLFQFIGELHAGSQGQPHYLQARIARNVDGLDQKLFHKALSIRRQFLQQNQHVTNADANDATQLAMPSQQCK